MAVYLIIEITVKDRELYARYVGKVPGVIERHGGRYLVRGGKVTPFSGNWEPERIVVVEFDTMEQVERCFGSPEYREIAPLREKSILSRGIIVEGCSPLARPI